MLIYAMFWFRKGFESNAVIFAHCFVLLLLPCVSHIHLLPCIISGVIVSGQFFFFMLEQIFINIPTTKFKMGCGPSMERYTIVILGLDNAGKSSIMHFLSEESATMHTKPTIGK